MVEAFYALSFVTNQISFGIIIYQRQPLKLQNVTRMSDAERGLNPQLSSFHVEIFCWIAFVISIPNPFCILVFLG